jgi:hypothetical protein
VGEQKGLDGSGGLMLNVGGAAELRRPWMHLGADVGSETTPGAWVETAGRHLRHTRH